MKRTIAVLAVALTLIAPMGLYAAKAGTAKTVSAVCSMKACKPDAGKSSVCKGKSCCCCCAPSCKTACKKGSAKAGK